MKQIWRVGVLILACLVVTGCRSESERLADMADRTVQMQSQQNQVISKTKEDIVALHRELQMERHAISKGLDQLERSRREIHNQRRSELAWAESFQFLAIVIAATTPLLLCGYLIWAASRNTSNAEIVNEVLMHELVSQQPRLIAGPSQQLERRNLTEFPIETCKDSENQSLLAKSSAKTRHIN